MSSLMDLGKLGKPKPIGRYEPISLSGEIAQSEFQLRGAFEHLSEGISQLPPVPEVTFALQQIEQAYFWTSRALRQIQLIQNEQLAKDAAASISGPGIPPGTKVKR